MLLIGLIALSLLTLILLYFESVNYEDIESRTIVVQSSGLVSFIMSILFFVIGFAIYIVNGPLAYSKMPVGLVITYTGLGIGFFIYGYHLITMNDSSINKLIEKRKAKLKK